MVSQTLKHSFRSEGFEGFKLQARESEWAGTWTRYVLMTCEQLHSRFAFHADVARIGSRVPDVLHFGVKRWSKEFGASSERLVNLQKRCMFNYVSCFNNMGLTNSRSIPWFLTKTKPTVVNAEFNLATKLSSSHGNSVLMSTTGISDISSSSLVLSHQL